MRIKIHKAGLQSTIQDQGRSSARAYGVPQGGAMDAHAYRCSNILMDNDLDAACIEIVAGTGWAAEACSDGFVACCGEGVLFWVNQVPVRTGAVQALRKGDVLDIKNDGSGMYAYLNTTGGWDVPLCLGSRSTCLIGGFGGHEGRALMAGDELAALHPQRSVRPKGQFPSYRHWQRAHWNVVRVFPGPELAQFSEAAIRAFTQSPYRVSSLRDRMGMRMSGQPLARSFAPEMISTGVLPGTVQVPPDGQPIVLLNDCQTTGGYPRIAQVCGLDLPKIAQLPTNQNIHFQWITGDF